MQKNQCGNTRTVLSNKFKMFISLSHRMISAEILGKLKMHEAILWANTCLKNKIETDSLLILATLNETDGTWEIKNYLEQSLSQLGLSFLPKEEALSCYIQSYVMEILERPDVFEKPLIELYHLYMENSNRKELKNFYQLYWANHSWKMNDENKNFYWDDFNLENSMDVVKLEAENWMKVYGKKYVPFENIKNTDDNHTQSIFPPFNNLQ